MALDLIAAIPSGAFVNPWKALAVVAVLLIWARILTWIDKDTETARLPREIINTVMFAGLVTGYALFFILSTGFAITFSILMGLFVIDLGIYFGLRARSVGLKDLKEQFSEWINSITKRGQPKKVKAVEGQVLMMDSSGVPEPEPDAESPELPRYEAAQLFLTKPLRQGAERIDLLAGEPSVSSFYVDGVRYDGDALDRNRAGAAVQFLKRVAGLDLNERRKPQTGTMRAILDGKKNIIQLTSQGSTAGESIRLIINPNDRLNTRLEDLGFNADQLESVKKLIAEPGGVVLLSAPKGQGLTSLSYGVIRGHDAFLFHVHTIERSPELDLEGITQNALPPGSSPADEAKQVSWVLSQEPDVLMLTSIEDPKSAKDLAKAAETKRAYVSITASSALDALKQWRRLVGDDSLALKNLKMVISGRLIRKLCAACKVGYTPDPTTLRKLNMNPDAVGKLFQARKEQIRDAKGTPVPCTFCHDLAFKGRTGIYEVMQIDDEMRSVIKAGGSESQIKQVMRKQRGRFLQEVALALVQAGETSVEEVLRVLKPDSGSEAGSRSPSSASPSRPPRTASKPPADAGAMKSKPPGNRSRPTTPSE